MQPASVNLLEKIELLTQFGLDLSNEKDADSFLERILLGAKKLTGADGGSLYTREGSELRFRLVHTDSLNLHMGGTSGQPITFPPVSLEVCGGGKNRQNVVALTAIEDRIINVRDAYADTTCDFSGTRQFDRQTGYRSRSMLAVPMKDHEDRIIGVLQLINAVDPVSREVVSFSPEDESLVASLASQAAVTLTRKHLIDGLENLLYALTRLIANAIDDKSPMTGHHCRRVPDITMALADAVSADTETFGPVHFSDRQRREIELAAWLHDCGKITVPEHVVDKKTKLETIFDRIHLVTARLEILRRDAEIRCLRQKLAAREKGEMNGDDAEAVRDRELAALDEIEDFLVRCNRGGEFLGDSDRLRISEIASRTVEASGGCAEIPLLTPEEVHCLSVSRGTLTDEERNLINNHVVATLRMLEPLPFPDYLGNVPAIASGHHERMDGKGYPAGTPAGELSIQARILAIADVFEALTASDRLYRAPNTVAQALTIMARMCAEGHFDRDLFGFFVRRRVYEDYARRHLKPEQVCEVDNEQVLKLVAGR